jgi:hypothetical protein
MLNKTTKEAYLIYSSHNLYSTITEKLQKYTDLKEELMPIPVAVRSKAWVFGRSLTRIVGLNADPSGRAV